MRWCLCKGVTLLSQIIFAPLTIQAGPHTLHHITLGIAPFHFKGAINFGLGKCFIFIKSSIIAGSVTPSDNEERTCVTTDLCLDQSMCPLALSVPSPPHLLGGLSSRRAAGHCGGGDAGARGTRGGGTTLV